MSQLERVIETLVRQHGIAAVFRVVRAQPGFCGNCGSPFEDGYSHYPANGMGACWVEPILPELGKS